jgi:hypothetical protein
VIQGALSGQKGNTGFDLWMFSLRQLPKPPKRLVPQIA